MKWGHSWKGKGRLALRFEYPKDQNKRLYTRHQSVKCTRTCVTAPGVWNTSGGDKKWRHRDQPETWQSPTINRAPGVSPSNTGQAAAREPAWRLPAYGMCAAVFRGWEETESQRASAIITMLCFQSANPEPSLLHPPAPSEVSFPRHI